MEKYPALRSGSYLIEKDRILIENDCVWTPEFDHTLILNGEYIIKINGENIEMIRDYGNTTTDSYKDIYHITLNKDKF